MGFDAVFDVGLRLDTSSLAKFVTSYRDAVKQIQAASASVPKAQTERSLQQVQAQVGPGLAAVQATGAPEGFVQAARLSIGKDLEKVAAVTGTQLANATQLEALVGQAGKASRAAAEAQIAADVIRQRDAEAERARLLATGTRAPAGPRAPLTDEERIERAENTARIQREGRARATRAANSALETNEGGARDARDEDIAAKARIRAADRRVLEATTAQAALEREIVAEDAAILVSKANQRGLIAQSLRGTPAVDTLVRAKVSTRGLGDEVRGKTAGEEAALLEDRDPQRVAQHALRTEELANNALRRAGEQAGADTRLLTATEKLTAARAAKQELTKKVNTTPADLAAAEKRQATEADRAARRTAADAANQAKAERDLVAATEKQALAAQKAAATPDFAQKFQARLKTRPGQPPADPLDFSTGRQLLGSGLLTSARFAVSGALLYGAVSSIKQMVTQASILEAEFNKIDAQFAALGQGGEAAGFKKAIFDISTATGEQADEVARVGFQMKGAFGGTTEAIDATTSAIQIARVTGLSLVEVVDSLTAASKSYGVPIRELGDEALLVQENFGVLAKESLQAFGDVGIVAVQAGLSLHELGGILGGLQQIAGRSGSALAEAIGRILPAIQESSSEILSLYQTVPQLAANFPKVRDLLGSGQTGEVLVQLTRDFSQLDQAQKNNIITQLGSRREAQTLIGILRQHGVILDYIDNKTKATGKTQEYFNKLQETLTQRMARLRREFEQFGQALFNAGLGDILKDIVTFGGGVAHVAAEIAKGFAAANAATHGLAIRMLELYAVFKLYRAFKGLSLLEGATGAKGIVAAGASSISGLGERATLGAYGARYRFGDARAASVASTTARGFTGAGTAIAGGASGTLAALGLTTPVVAGIAALAVGQAYQSQRAKLQTQAEKFRDQIKDYDQHRLEQILKDHSDVWEWVGGHIGLSTSTGEVRKELAADRYSPVKLKAEAARSAGLIGGDERNTDALFKRAKAGDDVAIALLELNISSIESDPAKKARLEAALAKQAAATEAEAAKLVTTASIVESVKTLQTKYEAGLASVGEYAKALADEIAKLQAQLPGLTGDVLKAKQEAIADLQADAAALPSKLAQGLADYKISEIELGGGGPEQKLPVLTALLKDPKFTDPAKRIAVAKQIAALEHEILISRAKRAETAAEEVAILTAGVVREPETRIETLIQAITAYDEAFTTYLKLVAGSGEAATKLLRDAVTIAIDRAISVADAVNILIDKEIADAQDKLNNLSGGGPTGRREAEGTDAALRDALDKAKGKKKIVNPGSTIPIPGGKTFDAEATQAAKERAAAEAKAAREKAKKDAEDEAQARLEYRKAELEGDPVGQAQVAIEEARRAVSTAKTNAEKLRAKTQLLEAQRSLIKAQLQVSDSARSIDLALANAAGDMVRVADIELDSARERLASALARNNKDDAQAARADIISKEAARAAAEISSQEAEADFLHEMDQISDAQYIARYRSILNLIPPEKVAERRRILLKLHELEKGTADDLNFDIPSQIKLPTLYEVRRLRQSEAAGSAYADNRVTNVQYNVLTPQDNQAALNDLLAVTSGSPRVGAVPGSY